MARRRAAQGANASFFAFQDIITAVSGILILIVIFLILMLEQPGLMNVPVEKPNNLTLGELDDLIRDAKKRIREFEVLKLEVVGASDTDLRAEIGELKAAMDGEENPEVKTLRNRLEALETELESLEKKAAELEANQNRLAGVAEQLRGRVESKADDLAKSKDTSQIWLHPGKREKEPVVIVVGEDGAELLDFSQPDQREEISIGEFRSILATTDKTAAYFVFFIRPGGISSFHSFSNLARNEDFQIGYRALDDKTEVKMIGDGS